MTDDAKTWTTTEILALLDRHGPVAIDPAFDTMLARDSHRIRADVIESLRREIVGERA